ncbi:MAG TPA: hypothetical protein VGF24_19570 [Vicinamibacterales bacterium]|jgi:hypothetical protein
MVHFVVVLLFSSVVTLSLVASPSAVARQASSARAHTLPTPDELPVIAEHHYRLSGSARPFLFWISRDNIGGGRMTWRRAADGTLGFELLMGSDPARAPFKANRWGYIREVVRGDSAELVAVKSETEEETVDEARASANQKDRDRTLMFIHEQVSPRETRASSAIVDVGRDATYRELDFVLDRMATIPEWDERVGVRPKATRPGFLVALTELMQSGVNAWNAADRSTFHYEARTLLYVHRAKPYELRQSDVEVLRDVMIGGRRYAHLLQGAFRIRNPATNYQSQFSVIYGLDDDLAAVPVRITYQPRWWLRTQLTLDPSDHPLARR